MNLFMVTNKFLRKNRFPSWNRFLLVPIPFAKGIYSSHECQNRPRNWNCDSFGIGIGTALFPNRICAISVFDWKAPRILSPPQPSDASPHGHTNGAYARGRDGMMMPDHQPRAVNQCIEERERWDEDNKGRFSHINQALGRIRLDAPSPS